MKKKQNKKFDFKDDYRIRYDVEKPDGYWAMNQEIDIALSLSEYPNEKNNHDVAERLSHKLIQDKHPGMKYEITCVMYWG